MSSTTGAGNFAIKHSINREHTVPKGWGNGSHTGSFSQTRQRSGNGESATLSAEAREHLHDGTPRIRRKDFRVAPGTHVKLSKLDPNDTHGMPKDEKEAKKELKHLLKKIDKLQGRLAAEGKHKVLVVLQAMDTGGKDGTVRVLCSGMNPAGVKVTSFKAPTHEELSHDYLWRVHPHMPGSGEIGIFNRSHYEDVLPTVVHGMITKAQARQRYEHINNFEKMATDEGTTVVKIFLHISKDEQKRRLQARLDNPEKNWKFSEADLKERKFWDDYQKQYEDVMSNTSTDNAPWYVVPANNKLYRDLVVAKIMLKTLEDLDIQTPEPQIDLSKVVVK